MGKTSRPGPWPLAVLSAWVLLLLALSLVPAHRYLWPLPLPVGGPGLVPWLLALAGAALVVLFWALRHLPPGPSRDDSVDARVAGAVLALLLGLGAWIRLYHAGAPIGVYWGDTAMEVLDPLNIVELGEHPLRGPRESVQLYFTALLLKLLPGVSLVAVQRLSSTLLDLAAVWILYLAGRELGGRRTGLIVAALAVFSRPLLMKVLAGFRHPSYLLAVSLVLLFALRILRRPSRAHLLQGAAALAFGTYTYTGFRAFVPFLSIALLAWTLARPGARPNRTWEAVLAVTVAVLALVWSLRSVGSLGGVRWLDPFCSAPAGAAVVVACLLLYGPKGFREPSSVGLAREGSIAVLLGFVLAMPMLFQQRILEHVVAQDFSHSGHPGGVWGNLAHLAGAFVAGGPDRADFGIPNDAYLDLPFLGALALGAGVLLVRPKWKSLFLGACALVGVVPYLLSGNPESGKSIGSLPALFLISAWGIDRLWRGLEGRVGKKALLGSAITACVLLVWGGVSGAVHSYRDWAYNPDLGWSEVRIVRQARRDAGKYRVFAALHHESERATVGALTDGLGIRLLLEFNVVWEKAGEIPRDVVVVYAASDAPVIARLREEYPDAEWSEEDVGMPQRYGVRPMIGRVRIPWDRIPRGEGGVFRRAEAPEKGWRREYYASRYGLARGVLYSADWVPSWGETERPPGVLSSSLRLKGNFAVSEDGRAVFRVNGPAERFVFKVDGKTILKAVSLDRVEMLEGKVRLKRGVHEAELAMSDPRGMRAPVMHWRIGTRGPFRPWGTEFPELREIRQSH